MELIFALIFTWFFYVALAHFLRFLGRIWKCLFEFFIESPEDLKKPYWPQHQK